MKRNLTMRRRLTRIALLGVTMAFTTIASISRAGMAQTPNWFAGVKIPAPPPPSPNAFDDFHNAFTLKTGGDAVDRDGSGITLAQKEQLLDDNQRAIDAVHAGFSHEYQPPLARSFAALMPYCSQQRALARLLLFASDTSREGGDYAASARYALDAIRLGAQIQSGAYLIGGLVGGACEAIGRQALWQDVDLLDGPEARAANAELTDIIAKRPSFADILQNEEWLGQGGIVEGFGHAKPSDLSEIQKETSAKDPRELFDRYTAKMDAFIAAARQPYAKRQFPDLSDKLSQTMIPAPRPLFFKADFAMTEDELLDVSLSLRAYYADRKSYPDTLSALIPKYLEAVPVDPFGKGEPLHYKSAGTAYRLYSIGPDGIDDGGAAIFDSNAKQDTPEERRAALRVSIDSKGDIVAGVNL